MRFLFILSFLVLSNLLFAQNNYSFFVAGHAYGMPGSESLGLFYLFKEKFEYLKKRPEIEFGILTGDIVQYSDTEHWNAVDNDIDELGLPVYFAFGNHGIANRSLVEQRYGASYYSFLHGNDLFIILDPNIDHWNISGKQLLFLKNTLNESASLSNHIFVFFHQVLWRTEKNRFRSVRLNSTLGRSNKINFWTNIEPLFKELENKVVMFAGDLGAGWWSSDVMYYNYENITLIASGMGSRFGDNFVVVNVSNDNISYDLISLNTVDILGMGNLEDTFKKNIIKNDDCVKISHNIGDALINIKSPVNIVNYELFGFYGKRNIIKQNIKEVSITIDASELESGVYMLKLILEDSSVLINRIIKI